MASLRKSKVFTVCFLFLVATVLFLLAGGHRQILKWGLQEYLGGIVRARVTIGNLQGGFLNGVTLQDVRVYQKVLPTPMLQVGEIATNFCLFRALPGGRHCVLSDLKIFLKESVSTVQEFSLPWERPMMFLPRSDFWRNASFAMLNGTVVESFNRKDTVLLSDLIGSLAPAAKTGSNPVRQSIEFFVGTSRVSKDPNKVMIYGASQSSRESCNVEISADFSRLDNMNLFLKNFHVLKGAAKLEGKIRSGRIESAQVEFRDVSLFFSQDKRVLKNCSGRMLTNDRYISIKDFKVQSEKSRMELAGDIQRIAFRSGQIDISRFLAKARLWSVELSDKPLDLEFQVSATVFYRNERTIAMLQWGEDVLESFSLLEGKLGINKLVELDFQGKYMPGQPFALDYKITSLNVENLKQEWLGSKWGRFFPGARLSGEGRAECQWDQIKMAGGLDWSGHGMRYRMRWTQQQVVVEDFEVDDATRVTGTLNIGHREKSKLVFEFQNESITRMTRALGYEEKVSLSGKFSGSLEVEGNLVDPAIQGTVDLRNGTLRGIPFREGRLHVNGKYPILHLTRSMIFIRKDMPVQVSGFVDLSAKDIFQNVKSEVKSVLTK